MCFHLFYKKANDILLYNIVRGQRGSLVGLEMDLGVSISCNVGIFILCWCLLFVINRPVRKFVRKVWSCNFGILNFLFRMFGTISVSWISFKFWLRYLCFLRGFVMSFLALVPLVVFPIITWPYREVKLGSIGMEGATIVVILSACA